MAWKLLNKEGKMPRTNQGTWDAVPWYSMCPTTHTPVCCSGTAAHQEEQEEEGEDKLLAYEAGRPPAVLQHWAVAWVPLGTEILCWVQGGHHNGTVLTQGDIWDKESVDQEARAKDDKCHSVAHDRLGSMGRNVERQIPSFPWHWFVLIQEHTSGFLS